MSKFESIKSEMAAGGSVHVRSGDQQPDRVTALLGIGAWIALFVLLARINIWMLWFVVGVLISVLFHEMGHFVTARRSGMKVTQFFIGFGPRIWSIDRNGVEYGLRAIPLGAFVRIIGMNNLDEVPEADEELTYRHQSFPKRMLVITAGSVMHMIIAVVLITAVYATSGRLEEIGKVVVAADVAATSPAAAAGLQLGDEVVSINGVAVFTADEVRAELGSYAPGTTIDLEIQRAGSSQTLTATLVQRPGTNARTGYLGIATDSLDRVPKSLPVAFAVGSADLVEGVGQAISGVAKVLNPFNVAGHLFGTNDDLSTRPGTLVGATRISDDVGTFDGWSGMLLLLAGVNVSVGVFNLFPLLPLDGGHAAIATYERIRSRRGQRYVADVAKLMPVLAVTIAVIGFMFLTGLYLDIAKPIQ